MEELLHKYKKKVYDIRRKVIANLSLTIMSLSLGVLATYTERYGFLFLIPAILTTILFFRYQKQSIIAQSQYLYTKFFQKDMPPFKHYSQRIKCYDYKRNKYVIRKVRILDEVMLIKQSEPVTILYFYDEPGRRNSFDGYFVRDKNVFVFSKIHLNEIVIKEVKNVDVQK